MRLPLYYYVNEISAIFTLCILISSCASSPTPVQDSWTEQILKPIGAALNIDDLQTYGIEINKLDSRIAADAYLTTPDLLKKYGYPVENHHVQTADGYILEMHRIPKPGGIPVYMQHGIMDSSAGWVIMGPNTAFAYRLSNLGYDVWLGNCRGNRYSRNHTFLSPDHKDFWDFSFHEIGMYDLPAQLDYVLKETGFEKAHYIGHSQGTTAFWVMCAMRPEYCSKVLSMQAMAPIAFMKYVKSPLIRAIVPFLDQLNIIFKFLGEYEFLPNNDFFKIAGQFLCKEEAITQAVCLNAIFLITGYNSEQLNKTMLPAILGHVPAGSSTKQFIHYGQLVKSGRFRMYDYGIWQNLQRYGTFSPPSYDLTKVKAPVALHFSMNDWLANLKDVHKLEERLPHIIKNYLVPSPKFNHLDFLIAMNSREMVQNEVIRVMSEVEKSQTKNKD